MKLFKSDISRAILHCLLLISFLFSLFCTTAFCIQYFSLKDWVENQPKARAIVLSLGAGKRGRSHNKGRLFCGVKIKCKYIVDGTTYIANAKESNVFWSKKSALQYAQENFKVGDEIDIYYNPRIKKIFAADINTERLASQLKVAVLFSTVLLGLFFINKKL